MGLKVCFVCFLWICICTCFCICAHVHVGTHTHVTSCMWIPQVNIECLSCFPSYFKIRSLIEIEVHYLGRCAVRVDRLTLTSANKFPGPGYQTENIRKILIVHPPPP